MVQLFRILKETRDSVFTNVFQFFQAGRSAYIFISGVGLLFVGVIVMIATFSSRDALASEPGWERFVAATGSNQWVSASILIASGCIVLSINYLPRLEGEA